MNTKVRFIKDHLDHKAGDIATISKGAANYLLRVGVIELYNPEDCGCGGPPKAYKKGQGGFVYSKSADPETIAPIENLREILKESNGKVATPSEEAKQVKKATKRTNKK